MYFYSNPPYFWLLAGLLIGMTSGAAFEATLKQLVGNGLKLDLVGRSAYLQGMSLQLPFVGICIGICVFLGSGLEIFGFPSALSYIVSVSLTMFIGWLVWTQLGKLLIQLERGGSKALDLDSFG